MSLQSQSRQNLASAILFGRHSRSTLPGRLGVLCGKFALKLALCPVKRLDQPSLRKLILLALFDGLGIVLKQLDTGPLFSVMMVLMGHPRYCWVRNCTKAARYWTTLQRYDGFDGSSSILLG